MSETRLLILPITLLPPAPYVISKLLRELPRKDDGAFEQAFYSRLEPRVGQLAPYRAAVQSSGLNREAGFRHARQLAFTA